MDVPDKRAVGYSRVSLDAAAMEVGARLLEGTHDFAAFCSHCPKNKSSVRTVYQLAVVPKGAEIDIVVTGNGFLHKMVRIISGTLVEIGLGKREPEEIKLLLEGGVRANAGITMPAKGLTLQSVEY